MGKSLFGRKCISCGVEVDPRQGLHYPNPGACDEPLQYLRKASPIAPTCLDCLPAHLVQRWKRQLATKYVALPSEERQSDRDEADKMINVYERSRWGDHCIDGTCAGCSYGDPCDGSKPHDPLQGATQ